MFKESLLKASDAEIAEALATTCLAARRKKAALDLSGAMDFAARNRELVGAGIGAGIGGLSTLRNREKRRNVLSHMAMGAGMGALAGAGSRLMGHGLQNLSSSKSTLPLESAESQLDKAVATSKLLQDAADNEIHNLLPVSPGEAVVGGAGGVGAYEAGRYGANRLGHGLHATMHPDRIAQFARDPARSGGLGTAVQAMNQADLQARGLRGKAKLPNMATTSVQDVENLVRKAKEMRGSGLLYRLKNMVGKATPAQQAGHNVLREMRGASPRLQGGWKGRAGAGLGGAFALSLLRNHILNNAREEAAKSLLTGQ